MNENIYIVNWRKLMAWLIPVPLRKAKVVALMFAVVAPINWLYNRFIGYKTDVAYRLSITPQAVYLQKMLNDRYDITLRRIRINPAVQYNPTPLYLVNENKPTPLYTNAEAVPLVLFTTAETTAYTVDFVVVVPVQVPFNLDEMTGLINLFKLESKNFKIIIS